MDTRGMQPSVAHKSSIGKSFMLLCLIIALTLAAAPHQQLLVSGQSSQPTILVWSNQYKSQNVTDTGLTVGFPVRLEINVSQSPDFNAFDLTFLYDGRFLNFSKVDTVNGTVFGSNPTFIAQNLVVPGELRLAVAGLGPGAVYRNENGTLAHIDFKVLDVGISPLTLGETRLTLASQEIPHTTKDGYFNNIGPDKFAPIALYTYSPQSPIEGDTVAFDASGSFDPDNATALNRGLSSFTWRFGDGSNEVAATPTTTHRFAIAPGGTLIGNFTVILTVTDGDRYIGINVQRVTVSERLLHDVEIFSITTSPGDVQHGKDVKIDIQLRNLGTVSEEFNLTIRYSPTDTVLANLVKQRIDAKQVLGSNYTLKTASLQPGVYTVKATVTIPQDDVGSNNEATAIVRVTESTPLLNPLLAVPLAVAAVAGLALYLSRRKGSSKSTEAGLDSPDHLYVTVGNARTAVGFFKSGRNSN